MARLIDADALLDVICGCFNIMEAKGVDMSVARTIVKSVLDNAPAIDAVPVVRCKDCKHFFPDYMNTIGGNVVVYRCELDHEYGRDDYYCADGERTDSPTCGPDYCEI